MRISRDAVLRTLRTFVIAFGGIAIPGFLGFLNAVTGWANSSGQKPFPDAHNLSFILIAALAAGMIALLNLIVTWLEDVTGKGIGRTPPTGPPAPTP